jgi:hypothetical protein
MQTKILSGIETATRTNDLPGLLAILAEHPEYYNTKSKILKDAQKLILQEIRRNPKIMRDIPEPLRDNEDFMEDAIAKYPWAAKYASDRLRNDVSFVLGRNCSRKVHATTNTIRCASKELLDNEDFIREATGISHSIIGYASQRLKQDIVFNQELIKEYPDAFPYTAKRLRENKEFVLGAIKSGVKELNNRNKLLIDESLLQDKDFLLRAVQNGLGNLPDIGEVYLPKDKQFVLRLIEEGLYFLPLIHQDLLRDFDFLRQAVQYGLKSVRNDFYSEDKDIVLYLFQNDVRVSFSDELYAYQEIFNAVKEKLSMRVLESLSEDHGDIFSLPRFLKNSVTDYQFVRGFMHSGHDEFLERLIEDYLKLKEQLETLNITYTGSLGTYEVARHFIEQRKKLEQKQLDPQKPIVIILQARDDHNNAFEGYGLNDSYPELIKKNQVLFFEIDTLLDLDAALLLITQNIPVEQKKTLIINAHGLRESIHFGQDDLTPALLDDVYGEIFKQVDITKLLLNSCLTGIGKNNEPNIANIFGLYIPTVFAPTESVGIGKIKINPVNGDIVNVIYRGDNETVNPVYMINQQSSDEEINHYTSDDFLNILSHVNCIIFNSPDQP